MNKREFRACERLFARSVRSRCLACRTHVRFVVTRQPLAPRSCTALCAPPSPSRHSRRSCSSPASPRPCAAPDPPAPRRAAALPAHPHRAPLPSAGARAGPGRAAPAPQLCLSHAGARRRATRRPCRAAARARVQRPRPAVTAPPPARERERAAPRAALSNKTGGDLLSQARGQVPSALRGLTALFGMGRGVSPSL